MAEIKVVSYKDERLEFFENQRRAVQKRYDRLEKTIDTDEPYLSERRELLSDCGRELSFYNDVTEMLEADVVPKSEVVREIFKNIDGITDLFAKGIISELEMYDMFANLKKKHTKNL